MIEKRRKRKKIKLLNFTIFFFVLSFLLFGTSTILLKAYSNSLAEQKQEAETEIKELEQLNESIYKEIEELDTENNLHLEELLKKTKLQKNLGNIVTIPPDNP